MQFGLQATNKNTEPDLVSWLLGGFDCIEYENKPARQVQTTVAQMDLMLQKLMVTFRVLHGKIYLMTKVWSHIFYL